MHKIVFFLIDFFCTKGKLGYSNDMSSLLERYYLFL